MNIPDENTILVSLHKLYYLKGIIAGSLSDKLSLYDYQTCIRYCNTLINIFKGMHGEFEDISDDKEVITT